MYIYIYIYRYIHTHIYILKPQKQFRTVFKHSFVPLRYCDTMIPDAHPDQEPPITTCNSRTIFSSAKRSVSIFHTWAWTRLRHTLGLVLGFSRLQPLEIFREVQKKPNQICKSRKVVSKKWSTPGFAYFPWQGTTKKTSSFHGSESQKNLKHAKFCWIDSAGVQLTE